MKFDISKHRFGFCLKIFKTLFFSCIPFFSWSASSVQVDVLVIGGGASGTTHLIKYE